MLSNSLNQQRLHSAAAQVRTNPKCAACCFGKQRRRPAPGKKSSVVKDSVQDLTKHHLQPGEKVSVDHFVSSTKGRLFTGRERTKDNEMYMGGCVFVDHATSFVHVEPQSCLSSHESKRTFMSENVATWVSCRRPTDLTMVRPLLRKTINAT